MNETARQQEENHVQRLVSWVQEREGEDHFQGEVASSEAMVAQCGL